MKGIKMIGKVFMYKALLSLLVLTHEVKAENLSVGPKVGLAISSPSILVFLGAKAGISYGVGLMGAPATDVIWGADLMYIPRGLSLKVATGLAGAVGYSANLNYLSLSLSLGAQNTTKSETVEIRTYYLFLPEFSFLLSAEECDIAAGEERCESIKDEVKSIDIGIGAGFGVEALFFEKINLGMEGRYVFGILNVFRGMSNRTLLLLLKAGYSL